MDRITSRNIKGIAILVMILHHLFPLAWTSVADTWYFPCLEMIFDSFKICVAMYAFLCGYGYHFSKDKSINYGIKRCLILLKHYWIQLFLIFIPVACCSGFVLTPNLLLRNMFGLTPNLNFFAWYVYFHIFAMLVLPLYTKLFKRSFAIDVVLAIVCCYLPEVLIHETPWYGENVVISSLFNCFLYLPCVLVGYLCAKHKVFEVLDKHMPKSKLMYGLLLLVVIFCRIHCVNVLGFALDTVYAPVFIYCWHRILRGQSDTVMGKMLALLGRYSTQVWFFHAVFFSTYIRDYCQWLLLLPNNPVMIILWCVVLCLAVAVPLELLAKAIDKLVGMMRKKINV